MNFLHGISLINDAPRPWGLYFQDSASPQIEALIVLHDNIIFYSAIILFGVAWIMASIIINSVIKKSSISNKYLNHGTLIELIWTVTPALILILIAFPSFKLLYLMDEVTDPSLTIFVEGHQWYWSYECPDFFSEDLDIFTEPVYSIEGAVNNLLSSIDAVTIPTIESNETPPIHLASFVHDNNLYLYDTLDSESKALRRLVPNQNKVYSFNFKDPYNVTKKMIFIGSSESLDSKFGYHAFKFSDRFNYLKNNGGIYSNDMRIKGGLRAMGSSNILKVFHDF